MEHGRRGSRGVVSGMGEAAGRAQYDPEQWFIGPRE
jgi:hypothetical protein